MPTGLSTTLVSHVIKTNVNVYLKNALTELMCESNTILADIVIKYDLDDLRTYFLLIVIFPYLITDGICNIYILWLLVWRVMLCWNKSKQR